MADERAMLSLQVRRGGACCKILQILGQIASAALPHLHDDLNNLIRTLRDREFGLAAQTS